MWVENTDFTPGYIANVHFWVTPHELETMAAQTNETLEGFCRRVGSSIIAEREEEWSNWLENMPSK